MLANKSYKTILTILSVTLFLSSCSILQGLQAYSDYNDDMQDEEYSTYSWDPKVNYGTKGAAEADKAILAFFKGNLAEAEQHVRSALAKNPKQSYALLIGAIIYEQTGRPNRARQYYEDLMLDNADEMTILGSLKRTSADPIYNTARQRMKMLDVQQSTIVLNNKKTGEKTFNVSEDFKPNINLTTTVTNPITSTITKQVSPISSDIESNLFDDGERFIMSRFLTFNKLSEAGLITKKEFLSRRNANIGALLPQTNKPSAIGLRNPVPATEVILDRLQALKTALEIRSITTREYASERNLIIDAILPLESLERAEPINPPTDLLQAAQAVRKLEVFYKLGLITEQERAKESLVIEKLIKIGTNNLTQPKLLIK